MKKTFYFILLASPFLFSACQNNNQKTSGADSQMQAYPTVKVLTQSVTLESDYPATLEGIQNIDIRPKIEGFIAKIFVDEGATVKKGEVLFRIDAPQYEQLVRTASASVLSAEADVNAAQLQVNKTKPLVEKDIISKYDLEAAQLSLQSKKAALAQAKAELVNAKVNLGYTTITSPVNGVIGSIPFKTGSLVSPSGTQPLTTVSNISKIYAYFSMNEKDLLNFNNIYEGTTIAEQMSHIPAVSLVLSDGTIYSTKGKIESINGLINTNTGSASLRATFPNPSLVLRSGASASIRLPQHLDSVLLIPQKSTIDLQGKKFVYIVDNKGVVRNTEIKVMEITKDNFYVVTKGLNAADAIVLEGFQSLKDGVQIKPDAKSVDSVYADLKK